MFYHFILDHCDYYSTVSPAVASETPHILDSLLHDKGAIAEHATDLAGAV